MLFKSLLEYNNDSIISMDSIGRITYANPATYEIFGYRYEELHNKFIFEFINKEYEKIFKLYLKEPCKEGQNKLFQRNMFIKKGTSSIFL